MLSRHAGRVCLLSPWACLTAVPWRFWGCLWTRVNMMKRLLIENSLWPKAHTRFTCENVSYKPNQSCATAHWRTCTMQEDGERWKMEGGGYLLLLNLFCFQLYILVLVDRSLIERRGDFFFNSKTESTMSSGLHRAYWIKWIEVMKTSVLYGRWL